MFNLNKILALTAVTIFMSACTVQHAPTRAYQHTPRSFEVSYWYKEGVSRSVTKDRVGYCKTEVNASRLSQEEAEKLVSYCMKADGYRMVTETKYL